MPLNEAGKPGDEASNLPGVSYHLAVSLSPSGYSHCDLSLRPVRVLVSVETAVTKRTAALAHVEVLTVLLAVGVGVGVGQQ